MNTSQRAARASQFVAGTIVIVGGVMLTRTLAGNWSEVSRALDDATWAWLALGAVVALASVAGLAERWRAAIRALGSDLSLGAATRMFSAGQLGKYAPGGVWQVVGQGELATRAGVPRRTAYASVMLSTISLVGGAAGVVAVGRLVGRGAGIPLWAIGAGSAITAVVLEPHLRRRLLRLARVDQALTTSSMGRLVAGTVPTWLCIGVATWCITRSLVADAPIGPIVVAAIASWLVGIVTLPAPGGIGVREGVFAASLHAIVPSVGLGTASLVALIARLVFVAVDLAWLPLGRLAGRQAEVTAGRQP